MSTTDDQLAVMQIATRMFTTADAKDFDAYEALLADEIDVDFGGVNDDASGTITAKEMRTSAETVVGPVEITQHMISSLTATVDGDEAEVHFYEEALHVHSALGDDPDRNTWVVHGKGTHRLRRIDGTWKIVAATLTPTRATGNTNLLAEVGELLQRG